MNRDLVCDISFQAETKTESPKTPSIPQVVYEYLLRSSSGLLGLLRGEPPAAPLSALHPVRPKSLLHTMFNIGETVFDRLLVDYDELDWELMLEIPLGVLDERLRIELIIRPELSNILGLGRLEDREAANFLKKLCAKGTPKPAAEPATEPPTEPATEQED